MCLVERFAAAVAKWATANRVAVYAGALLGATIVAAAAAIVLGDPPFDAFGRPIAEDFVAKSIGGRIAAEGRFESLYDVGLQRRTQVAILGTREGYDDRLNPFLSPPFVAAVYAPFTALPYLLAVAIWTMLSVLLVVASLGALLPLVPFARRAGLPRLLLVAFSLHPTIELLGNGQDGAVSLAILVAGFALLTAGRDVAAGAILGFGAFKPQIFFLLPLLLALERRWRALVAGTCVAALLAAVSLVLVGPDGARDYLALLQSDLYRRGIGEELRWKMLSLPAFAGALLPPEWRAGAERVTQVSFAIVAAVVLTFAVRRRPEENSRASIALPYAVAVLLTACANPHFFLHDGPVLLLPVLVLLDRAPGDERLRALLVAGALLAWTAPLRQVAFGTLPWPLAVGAAPWPALVVGALAAHAVRSMRVAPARTS